MADEQKTSGALTKWASGGGNVAKREEVAKALLESANAGASGSGGDVVFLSFSGQGANYTGWKLGRDKVAPDPEDLFVLDPETAIEGWTCWKGGSACEKHEWSVFERATQAVPASALADHGPYADGDGWQFAMGISMFNVDDPQQEIKFTTTSKSGRNVMADLNTEVAKRILAGEPEVPVAMLSSETFPSKGKVNGKPKFDIEGWVTRQEIGAFIAAGDDADLDDLLAGKYAVEEEAAADAEEAEEKPKRRRGGRRKAAA